MNPHRQFCLQPAVVASWQHEAHWLNILDNLSELVCCFRADGTLTFVNRAYCQYFGKLPAELLGSKFFSLVLEPDRQIPKQQIAVLLHTKGSLTCEYQVMDNAGFIRWQQWTSRAICGPDGQVIEFQAVGRDITDCKRTEEALSHSEAKYRSLTNDILNTCAVGILILDASFRVVWMNQTLEQFFGIRRADVIGQDKRALLCDRLALIFENATAFASRLLATYKDNTYSESFECHVLPGHNREERWLDHWSQPIRSGVYSGGRIEHYTDITERKRAEDLLRRQAERDRLLNTLTQHLLQSLDLDQILAITVRDIQQTLQADWVFVVQFKPDGRCEIIKDVRTWQQTAPLPFSLPEPSSECCRYSDLAGFNLPSDSTTNSSCLTALRLTGVASKVVAPLVQHHEDASTHVWGLLVVCSYKTDCGWQPLEVDLVRQISNQLAIAIQRSELYQRLQVANQELQRLATLDGLTEIANRHRFDYYLKQEWQRLAREQGLLSIVLCDVDYFKRYNDSYGHLAGDACLRQIAQTISRVAKRPADLAARYGGEEFAIVLPNTDRCGAIQVAKAIQAELRCLNLVHASSLVGHVTVSLGIATACPHPDGSPSELIAHADEALYQAKKQGRDRYCVAAIGEGEGEGQL